MLKTNSTPDRIAHTPGPWEVRSGDVIRRPHWIRGGGHTIAEVFWDEYFDEGDPAANAALIAAAPDLLDACKLVQPVLERYALEGPAGNSVAEQFRDALRSAIAKAEGVR